MIMNTTREFVGRDLEEAYARIIGGVVSGGLRDGGKDIVPNDRSMPAFQVKSSWHFAKKFLATSLSFRRFIPICVGEPGSREEMVIALRESGAWVGRDIPQREEVMQKLVMAKAAIQV